MDLMKDLSKRLIKAHYPNTLIEPLLFASAATVFSEISDTTLSHLKSQVGRSWCKYTAGSLFAFSAGSTQERAAFSMHLDETFNKRSLMQISMIPERGYWSEFG